MEREVSRLAGSQRIGFLALLETALHDGYIGAILITDERGVPHEFRCTHPVKPTAIQKPLYGDALKPYIGVELCGKSLVRSVSNKPSFLIVKDDFLLDVRPSVDLPVLCVRRAGEVIEVSPSGAAIPTLPRQKIDCPSGRFQPIVVVSHPDYGDDQATVEAALQEIFGYLDLLEPFERIAKALETLGKQDGRFR